MERVSVAILRVLDRLDSALYALPLVQGLGRRVVAILVLTSLGLGFYVQA
jgi:hypothetical protein